MYIMITQNLEPFGQHALASNTMIKILNGERPEIPSSLLNSNNVPTIKYIKLMKKCWAYEPSDRPQFSQLILEIETIKQHEDVASTTQ